MLPGRSADHPERHEADLALPLRWRRAGDPDDRLARATPAFPARRNPPRPRHPSDADQGRSATRHADAPKAAALLRQRGKGRSVHPPPLAPVALPHSRSRSDRGAGTDRPTHPLRAAPAVAAVAPEQAEAWRNGRLHWSACGVPTLSCVWLAHCRAASCETPANRVACRTRDATLRTAGWAAACRRAVLRETQAWMHRSRLQGRKRRTTASDHAPPPQKIA
jgi:hypothetical protein